MKSISISILLTVIFITAFSQSPQNDELNQVKENVAKLDKKSKNLGVQITNLKNELKSQNESMKKIADELQQKVNQLNDAMAALKQDIEKQKNNIDGVKQDLSMLKTMLFLLVFLLVILVLVVYFVVVSKIRKCNHDLENRHLKLHESRYAEMKTYVDQNIKQLESKLPKSQ